MANGQMKRCSTLLIIREMYIKTTMRYHLRSVRMAVIKKNTNKRCWQRCGKKGNLYPVSGNVSWCSHYGKQYSFLKKLKIELPYDPAIPLWDIQLKKKKKPTSLKKCLTLECSSVQFSSVAQSCLTLCHPMNRSTPSLPVHHQLPEFTQTHIPSSQ